MKWLQNNLFGMVLLGICGSLLLVAAALQYAWNRPISASGVAVPDGGEGAYDPGADRVVGRGAGGGAGLARARLHLRDDRALA